MRRNSNDNKKMTSLFPIKFLSNTFYDFDDIVFYFNSSIWIHQIFGCLIYCLFTRRYLPPTTTTTTTNNNNGYSKSHFMIKQLNFYFISEAIIYALEMIYSTIMTSMFERFLHHLFAILLFAATVYESKIVCVSFLIPTFIHSAYWALIRQVWYFFKKN